MTRLERIQKAKEILTQCWDSAAFGIYTEVVCINDLTDEQTARLIELGLSVYQENDLATPTGIGCVIFSLIEGEEYEPEDITYNIIEDRWLCEDRT